MSTLISAIYENGIIRPLQPLALPEGQSLQIQIVMDESMTELRRITQVLETSGILTPPPYASHIEPVPESQWRELTERLKALPGKLLSEIIIEERGAW